MLSVKDGWGKKERREEVEEYKTMGLVAGDLLLLPGQQSLFGSDSLW